MIDWFVFFSKPKFARESNETDDNNNINNNININNNKTNKKANNEKNIEEEERQWINRDSYPVVVCTDLAGTRILLLARIFWCLFFNFCDSFRFSSWHWFQYRKFVFCSFVVVIVIVFVIIRFLVSRIRQWFSLISVERQVTIYIVPVAVNLLDFDFLFIFSIRLIVCYYFWSWSRWCYWYQS